MTFALQKRCSTAELSRQSGHRSHHERQFQAVATSCFGESPADVALDGAGADHEPFCDAAVAEAFEQKPGNPFLSAGERACRRHERTRTAESIPRSV